MNTYTIRELQNANSYRAGDRITAKDLSSAKRMATRAQMFQGTVLVVEQNGVVLSRREGGRWVGA